MTNFGLYLSVFISVFCAAGIPNSTVSAQSLDFSDVSVRSFSVLVRSDTPLTDAEVRVFTDAQGTTDITSALTQVHLTAGSSASLDAGLAKVDVQGASPGDVFFVQAELTTEAGGTVLFPAAPPFPSVTLMNRTGITDSDGTPLSASVIVWSVQGLDGTGVLPGSLVTLEAPGVTAYPISGVVDPSSGVAVLDLANLYGASSGVTAAPEASDAVRLESLRGLVCPLLEGDVTINWRRAPQTRGADDPGFCFSPDGLNADYDCDGTIGELDYQTFAAAYGTGGTASSCAFNPDFDLARLDRTVGSADFNLLLSIFGAAE